MSAILCVQQLLLRTRFFMFLFRCQFKEITLSDGKVWVTSTRRELFRVLFQPEMIHVARFSTAWFRTTVQTRKCRCWNRILLAISFRRGFFQNIFSWDILTKGFVTCEIIAQFFFCFEKKRQLLVLYPQIVWVTANTEQSSQQKSVGWMIQLPKCLNWRIYPASDCLQENQKTRKQKGKHKTFVVPLVWSNGNRDTKVVSPIYHRSNVRQILLLKTFRIQTESSKRTVNGWLCRLLFHKLAFMKRDSWWQLYAALCVSRQKRNYAFVNMTNDCKKNFFPKNSPGKPGIFLKGKFNEKKTLHMNQF